MNRPKRRGRDGRYGLFDNQPGTNDAPAEIHDNPLTRPCPHCKATTRQPCTTPGPRGTRTRMTAFHPSRRHNPSTAATQEPTRGSVDS